MQVFSPVEIDQTKEQPHSNENNPSTETQILSNVNSQAPILMSTNQHIPYSSPSTSVPYIPPQIDMIQNPSVPAFQTINSQYSSLPPGTTSETIKPFVLMTQVTTLPSFTTQESTSISTPQELTITSSYPAQSDTSQVLTYQSSTSIFPPQSSYSQYHPTNVGGTTTTTDVSNSKEISNYFTQFQTQVSQSTNNSSTIPMFSVKNFPQISPLAQPLGKLYTFNYLCIFIFLYILVDCVKKNYLKKKNRILYV